MGELCQELIFLGVAPDIAKGVGGNAGKGMIHTHGKFRFIKCCELPSLLREKYALLSTKSKNLIYIKKSSLILSQVLFVFFVVGGNQQIDNAVVGNSFAGIDFFE